MELEKMHAFFEKYFPSKKFIWVIGGVAVGVLGLILFSNYRGYHRIFNAKPPVSAAGTVSDVVSRDSNDNGIPDWEESLWGLDPNGNGADNKRIIEKKEADANMTPADGTATAANPTDTFSQQILSTILALHQSGSLTPEIVTSVAASVGDSLDARRVATVRYAVTDMVISKKTPALAKEAYRTALKRVIDKYAGAGIGTETSIIADGLGSGGADALKELTPIADAYTKMSKDIIGLATPSAVAQNALDLANATAAMGAALTQIANMYTDALGGMVGVDDYTKASTTSDAASKTLAAYFAA